MSSTSHQHVRIADVSLDLPSGGLDGVEIRSALSKRPVVVSFLKKFLDASYNNKVVFLDGYPSATREFYVCA